MVLTIEETCNLLRVCRTTIYWLRKRGELRGFSVGSRVFFTEEEIQDYIQRQMKKSAAE